uniref:Uncharacterized protein n=1 Tax=Medicago truncatula TaxID=3880 RepID=Q2HRF4_MEDTR|nr:hypothetical protein MtrDRAFT_AC158502g28v2 [Medicago truncatula]
MVVLSPDSTSLRWCLHQQGSFAQEVEGGLERGCRPVCWSSKASECTSHWRDTDGELLCLLGSLLEGLCTVLKSHAEYTEPLGRHRLRYHYVGLKQNLLEDFSQRNGKGYNPNLSHYDCKLVGIDSRINNMCALLRTES